MQALHREQKPLNDRVAMLQKALEQSRERETTLDTEALRLEGNTAAAADRPRQKPRAAQLEEQLENARRDARLARDGIEELRDQERRSLGRDPRRRAAGRPRRSTLRSLERAALRAEAGQVRAQLELTGAVEKRAHQLMARDGRAARARTSSSNSGGLPATPPPNPDKPAPAPAAQEARVTVERPPLRGLHPLSVTATSKCPYCDFASRAGSGDSAAPLHRTRSCGELRAQAPPLPRRCDSRAARSASTLRRRHALSSGIRRSSPRVLAEAKARSSTSGRTPEITLEANPGTTDRSRACSAFRAAGANRILDRRAVCSRRGRSWSRSGRKHSGGDAVRAYQVARAAGFDNISLDLIHGAEGAERGRRGSRRAHRDRAGSRAPELLRADLDRPRRGGPDGESLPPRRAGPARRRKAETRPTVMGDEAGPRRSSSCRR